ncbi:MAG: ATPase [marine bacterium B5-7]|nr:MAG: ATPase [marine bacterium B5-7]
MLKRTLAKTIQEASQHFPVLLLSGPRQIGKTTLLEMCAEDKRHYVTLDDFQARSLAQTDPALFLQAHPAPVIIDEVQYAPALLSAIKMLVDKEKVPGMFWLTGSQKFHLMRGVTESLAGRVAIIDMLGLSQAEIDGRSEKLPPFLPTSDWIQQAKRYSGNTKLLHDVYKQIWLGAYPKLHQDPLMSREMFYHSYVQTYIQRDVKDILNITDQVTFMRFLRATAVRTGQLLNYSDLARDVDIDHKTAKAWLSVLETAGLVYLLQPYHRNVNKRLLKTPKIYFLDTGLCAYLTQWPTAESLEMGPMNGAILETYLFSEILKSYWHHGLEAPFYYYRDIDQQEVDLVIETGEALYPVEFKKTASPGKSACKNFHALKKLGKPIGEGAVVCFVERDTLITQDVHAIPVGFI